MDWRSTERSAEILGAFDPTCNTVQRLGLWRVRDSAPFEDRATRPRYAMEPAQALVAWAACDPPPMPAATPLHVASADGFAAAMVDACAALARVLQPGVRDVLAGPDEEGATANDGRDKSAGVVDGAAVADVADDAPLPFVSLDRLARVLARRVGPRVAARPVRVSTGCSTACRSAARSSRTACTSS